MEIISGQQENKASGRIGNEFSLYPFGSPQLFQILENKNGRQWRWGLRVISGPLASVKGALAQPSRDAESWVAGCVLTKSRRLSPVGSAASGPGL